MKIRKSIHWMVFAACLLLASCAPAVVPQTATPSVTATADQSLLMTAQMGLTLSALLTQTPTPCPACFDSDMLTAAMGTALTNFPTNPPPAGVTVVPVPGDLGWGAVYGEIVDGTTNLPIVGATVKCEQRSYTSPYLCNGVTTTDQYGRYRFSPVYFNNKDLISLIVEADGYELSYVSEDTRIRPELQANLGLFPRVGGSLTSTSTPYISCTPPVCTEGVLTCGAANGCPGGCGTVCQLISPTP
jgi:hypothetical protein